jgi:hypothetical protein
LECGTGLQNRGELSDPDGDETVARMIGSLPVNNSCAVYFAMQNGQKEKMDNNAASDNTQCEIIRPPAQLGNFFEDWTSMKSKYGISGRILSDIRLRYQNCVYCDVKMPDWKDRTNQHDFATIEHLYPPGNDTRWISWCCNGCNMGHKTPLREWFTSSYCIQRNINENTVAYIIREFLASGLKEYDQIWLEGREDKYLNSAPWSPALEDGQQFIQRDTSSERDLKSFDRVLSAIRERKYAFDFRGMESGKFGRYYGFMYWFDENTLSRIPLADSAMLNKIIPKM